MIVRHCQQKDRASIQELSKDPDAYLDSNKFRDLFLICTGAWPYSRGWILEQSGEVLGFAYVNRVPGLDAVYTIDGLIQTSQRRKGHGSRLFKEVMNELRTLGAKELSWAGPKTAAPAHALLKAVGFELAHTELHFVLKLEDMSMIDAPLPEGFAVVEAEWPESISQFTRLYDAIFSDLPWYQAYSDEEVSSLIDRPGKLLFLMRGRLPVGICLIHIRNPEASEIEPIGIITEYRDLGLGTALLAYAISYLQQAGARNVQIAAWEENKAAVAIYSQFGFSLVTTKLFLSLKL